MNEYKTPGREASAELTERKSRFIGYVRPVQDPKGAACFLAEIKSLHPQARHHVYAYRLRDGQLCRFSDDGEPQGTAGKPVLDILTGRELWDACFVVVRYFGGILLGMGGLVRAYSQAAAQAAQAAGTALMRPCVRVSLDCEYHQYGKLASALALFDGWEEESGFGERVQFRAVLPAEQKAAFARQVQELTGGQSKIIEEEEKYFPFAAGENGNLSNK